MDIEGIRSGGDDDKKMNAGPDLASDLSPAVLLPLDTWSEDLAEEGEESDLFEHLKIVVDRGQSLLRIDKFLLNRLEHTSRSRIQHVVDAGNILVNAKPAKPSYKVKPGDVITIVLAYPPRDIEVYPENIPLDIFYEDEDIILVNKPAGMVVHPGFNNYDGTLVNALAWHFDHLPSMPGNPSRPGLVHRIDKDTTGLILISKNEFAMTWLAKQFYDHTIDREYHALVWGNTPDEGEVSGFIGRSMRDRRVMELYTDEEKGKWSLTRFKTVERFGYVSLVSCKLETGKTHQIRSHMRSIGHPLFGDPMYGGDFAVKGQNTGSYKQFVDNALKLMPGQALHARTLGFIHPQSRKMLFFESELPLNFRLLLDKWRNYSLGTSNQAGSS